MRPATRLDVAATAGFSLVELLVAMGLLTIIMGATMSGLADVMKGNELVMTISSMNGNLRAGMDVMIRDLLQTGSGLPASHTVNIPSGANSQRVRIPGPPGTAFETACHRPGVAGGDAPRRRRPDDQRRRHRRRDRPDGRQYVPRSWRDRHDRHAGHRRGRTQPHRRPRSHCQRAVDLDQQGLGQHARAGHQRCRRSRANTAVRRRRLLAPESKRGGERQPQGPQSCGAARQGDYAGSERGYCSHAYLEDAHDHLLPGQHHDPMHPRLVRRVNNGHHTELQ